MDCMAIPSPLGVLTLWAEGGALVRLSFGPAAPAGGETALLRRAAAELAEYFSGKRRVFDLRRAFHRFAEGIVKSQLQRLIPYGSVKGRKGHESGGVQGIEALSDGRR